jgi:hypothetical protein
MASELSAEAGMTTSEVLIAAKARLTPATWAQGADAGSLVPGRRECAGIAIMFGCAGQGKDFVEPVRLFSRVTTGRDATGIGSIARWNDAPGRTLRDVHDAFDAAIAIAQEHEARELAAIVRVNVFG